MRDIVVTFPGLIANDHITFEVEEGTIHCLLGENGSGKTTLMNVLFGLYKKDSGTIFINEKEVSIKSPSDAEALGIGMVHQHFMLVEELTVLENIILGAEKGRFVIDRRSSEEAVQSLVDRYSFNLDINRKVRDISVGMRQKVEILKLLYRGAKILIFDEPTAVLTPQEVGELFVIFRTLISQGRTIIFITHKLNEIFDVSDYVTILRKGKCTGTAVTSSLTPVTISEMMIGRQLQRQRERTDTVGKDEVFSLRDITLLPLSSPISFSVHKGEIVGIAGIDGNGQMELEEIITGVRTVKSGSIIFNGEEIRKMSTGKRREKGLAYIPSDRAQSGVLGRGSVEENFLLGHQDSALYKKHGFVDYRALLDDTLKYKEEFDIRFVSPDQVFSSLSGGNQQKVVLAREVSKNVAFVLASQPIRGLDISAIEFIHNTLMTLREEGKAVLLISAELGELLELSDRILVLYSGNITGEFRRDEFDENRIGLAMIGEKGGEGK